MINIWRSPETKRPTKKTWWPIPIMTLGGILLILLLGPGSVNQQLLTLVLIWATLGLSWNIIGGYAGQISFGHGLFFGIGALTSALMASEFDIPPVVSVFPAILIAAVVAVLLGWPTFRLAGIYFSLATLVFPLMLRPILNYLGLHEISVPYKVENGALYLQFDDPRTLTYVALGVMVLAAAITIAVQHSRFGAALVAIRENEPTAAAAGVNAQYAKQRAYMLSAAIAAIAGVLYAQVLLVVTPDSVFALIVSVQAMIIPMLGGRATVWGPIIGAAILITLSNVLISAFGAQLPGINGVLYGVAIVAMVFLAPEGIYWKIADVFRRRRRRPNPVSHELALNREWVNEVAGESRRKIDPAGVPLLEVKAVSKSFRGLHVLDDVTFTVRQGEIVGVIGPNGAGKTTLFNVINGFVRADEGSVTLKGRELVGIATYLVARQGVGRTFQVVRILPRETVLGNVRVSALHSCRSVHEADRRAEHSLALVGLLARAQDPVSGLDARELRLLELARAVTGAPQILLVDEILAGLGATDIVEVVGVLRKLRDTGMTVVIIEHTMSAMRELVDRLVVLDSGRVIAEGAPDVVLSDSKVIEAYLGRKWVKGHA